MVILKQIKRYYVFYRLLNNMKHCDTDLVSGAENTRNASSAVEYDIHSKIKQKFRVWY